MRFMIDGDGDARRRRHTKRRRELLEAATDYVFNHGLSELSLRPLGAALDVSHRTLLYYFGSREKLFSEILQEARLRERRLITARVEQQTEDGGFAEVMEQVWGRSLEHLPFFRLYYEVQGLALQEPERYGPFLEQGLRDWLELIERLLRREGLPADRARPLATLIWAAARGLQLDVLATGETERATDGYRELTASVDAALQRYARELA
jgi:AcrR family transcriptional regulator